MGINNDPYYFYQELIFYALFLIVLYYYLPILITIFVLVPLVIKMYTKLSVGIYRGYERLDGKTAIITGANIGIGLETAKDFARRGAKVILACRSPVRGHEALVEIKSETGSENVFLKICDLSSLKSVRKFCKEINSEENRLDILVNNAGAALMEKSMTEDKLETNMQANHYGPFLLTHLLLDLMKRTEKSRIVNVSSHAHFFTFSFDFDNLNSEKEFGPFLLYCRTKLANIYFTTHLATLLKNKGISNITVNALHPGAVRTAFLTDINKNWWNCINTKIQSMFYKTAEEGAQTTIYLALSPEVEDVSGEYFADCKKHFVSGLAKNKENAKRLWDQSVKAVGLRENETIVPLN